MEPKVEIPGVLITDQSSDTFEVLQQAADDEFQDYLDYLNNETLIEIDDPVVLTRKDLTTSVFGGSEHLINILAAEIPDASQYSIVNFNNGKQFINHDANLTAFQLEQLPIIRNLNFLNSSEFQIEEKFNSITVTSNRPVTLQAAEDLCHSVSGHLSYEDFSTSSPHKEYLHPKTNEVPANYQMFYRFSIGVSEESAVTSTILTVVCQNQVSINLTWRDNTLHMIRRSRSEDLEIQDITTDRQINLVVQYYYYVYGEHRIYVYRSNSSYLENRVSGMICPNSTSTILNFQLPGIKSFTGGIRNRFMYNVR